MAFFAIFNPCVSVLISVISFNFLLLASSVRPVHPIITNPHHRQPIHRSNHSQCALFMGSWVRDETYPIYQASSCPRIIDPEFNCQMYGRPDSNYLKYRWKPANCELPRFNGLEFLLRMRGKTVMFVGDSLGRNQWESLICMTWSAVQRSATELITRDPLYTFKFLDYGVDLSFYRAPYLVDVDAVDGRRVLKLEDISKNARAWMAADVLMFNTGHWWTHKGSLKGWDMMESGGSLHEEMDRLVALNTGLKTWARWADSHVESTNTRIFFQSVSPTHYNPSEWSAGATSIGKSCYGETSPMSGSAYPGIYPGQMKVIDMVIREMRHPAYILDITTLSAMRKDAHPSIYTGDLSPGQRAHPDHSADCSHWCLPGLPDTWNQLFYTALLF
ncbi:putative PMR5 domain, PC-Esterase [Helianthus annuus]|uniref:PMR5 domain, PC-Esterase, trichome birefringence-like 45/PMR5 n=1 Tax=Helianthus annuus TaxID=4232 RepID=A0A251VMD9_HELAN|nr:protein PMR5 [Helianthus annuus]KAF5821672.1 putative PMR5 domain, PC-Esterase, trichome birefringence-like 45/PMR5 [Helianthus annuus]KAJ0611316.1 putative PMR5 domain, PC-Esterase [Helianthus annuus]KAJ0622314.1 putative PMR5 domain, PC-Esterase, trichome birefringence-like family [Helianthus annuus]KAJ0626590.1 putative PMR5 domain, PC-Esterase [Helianthus annuus]KAJ0782934.1 putative PMR5 domain, PC-Esterase [Helianthus annuus]